MTERSSSSSIHRFDGFRTLVRARQLASNDGDRMRSLTTRLATIQSHKGVRMIPDFDERGYLPPGIHLASLDEIDARFGRQSEVRRVQMESLRWLVALAKRGGC